MVYEKICVLLEWKVLGCARGLGRPPFRFGFRFHFGGYKLLIVERREVSLSNCLLCCD